MIKSGKSFLYSLNKVFNTNSFLNDQLCYRKWHKAVNKQRKKVLFPRFYNQDYFEMENWGKWWRWQNAKWSSKKNSFEIFRELDLFTSFTKELYLNSLFILVPRKTFIFWHAKKNDNTQMVNWKIWKNYIGLG